MSPGLHALPAPVGPRMVSVDPGGASDGPAEVPATSVTAAAITELAEAGTTHAPSVEIVHTFTLEIKSYSFTQKDKYY